MALLDRTTIVSKCATASGVTPDKAEEVFRNMVTVLGNTTKREGVTIDGFGRFGPIPAGVAPARRGMAYFLPAAKLVEALTTDEQPIVKKKKHGRQAPALRPEDADLIERWLRTRRGSEAERTNESVLFDEEDEEDQGKRRRGPSVFWSDETVTTARNSMRTFARRCGTPLESVGLVGNPGYAGVFNPRRLKAMLVEGRITAEQYWAVVKPLRAEIAAYANDYSARATPRVAKLTHDKGTRDLVWRTVGWVRFVRYATDFYNWLEIQDLRPRGSNPLRKIMRPAPKDFSKGKIMVVRRWYRAILEYPHLDPRERALVSLLSMGMRNGETGHILLKNVALSKTTITVKGKRNKVRTIWLFPEVVAAVAAYLETRRHSASPFLFPGRGGKGMHIWSVRALVKAIAGRVFPYSDQAQIREHVHPHGFRHWYVSEWLARGGNPKVLMEQTGHENYQVLARYIHADDELVEREVTKMSRTPWVKVGR